MNDLLTQNCGSMENREIAQGTVTHIIEFVSHLFFNVPFQKENHVDGSWTFWNDRRKTTNGSFETWRLHLRDVLYHRLESDLFITAFLATLRYGKRSCDKSD